MHIKKYCPKCNSNKIKIIRYMGINCIVCDNCGFDETESYEVFPEEKKSQVEKGRYSPYKAGGHRRSK